MPKRTQRKRAQRRQTQLENDINTNGMDDHRGGVFKVYDRKAMRTIEGHLNWEQAVKVWNEHDNAIILSQNSGRKG